MKRLMFALMLLVVIGFSMLAALTGLIIWDRNQRRQAARHEAITTMATLEQQGLSCQWTSDTTYRCEDPRYVRTRYNSNGSFTVQFNAEEIARDFSKAIRSGRKK